MVHFVNFTDENQRFTVAKTRIVIFNRCHSATCATSLTFGIEAAIQITFCIAENVG
jgi:hypothetical protein